MKLNVRIQNVQTECKFWEVIYEKHTQHTHKNTVSTQISTSTSEQLLLLEEKLPVKESKNIINTGSQNDSWVQYEYCYGYSKHIIHSYLFWSCYFESSVSLVCLTGWVSSLWDEVCDCGDIAPSRSNVQWGTTSKRSSINISVTSF